jgi:hypothetical protein
MGKSRYEPLIIEELRKGGVHNKSGQATADLRRRLGGCMTPAGFSGLLGQMEAQGDIVRDVRGKRCYAIALNGKYAGELKVSVIPTEPEPDDEPELPPAAINYNVLAQALLAETVAVWNKPMEFSELREKLHEAREEAGRWRSRAREDAMKLRTAEDKLKAQTTEIKGLRERARMAEDNLKTVLDSGRTVIDEEVRKRVDKFMRERPKG